MKSSFLIVAFCLLVCPAVAQSRALVFQSDFGLKDGAVSAMKGVAYSVSGDVQLFDLTHEIPPYNIREAAVRLRQTAPYWPAGTVFVSVVDPGVGSDRKAIVMKSKSGHFFVTPDNGTITFVAGFMGVEAIREIDEARNRLPRSGESHTFHGRDIFAYTGARLAAGIISFEQVGPLLDTAIILPATRPSVNEEAIRGTIDILDVQYGNVWTNIGGGLLKESGLTPGRSVRVIIQKDGTTVFDDRVRYEKSFAAVEPGQNVAYLNSLLNFSLAINRGDFAGKYRIESGPGWTIAIIRDIDRTSEQVR